MLENDKPAKEVSEAHKKQLVKFQQSVEACKRYRRKLISDWQTNVDYRRGKPFASQSDEDRIAVPLDWSLAKDKEAQLFSKMPAVRVSHAPDTTTQEVSPWVYRYEQKINDTAATAGIEAAVSECVVDCINASGIGVAIVTRDAITEMVEMPAFDLSLLPPELQMIVLETGMMPDGTPIPTELVPRQVDSRYTITRISPADFLWPLGFTGSDFNQCPWVGRTGRISWPEAVQKFGLTEEDKRFVIGEDRTQDDRIDKIIYDADRLESELYQDVVEFDELFYKEFHYSTEAKSFSSIHHLVFITGKDEPVIDEQWAGQQIDPETGEVLGAMKYPIQALTLTYITDDAIPPSDTAVGRPQVNEINKARTQMNEQRERNIPIDWFDVNRVDPMIQHALLKGTWKKMIPVMGVGTNVIGSIPRSGMPADNYTFDRIAKDDFNRATGFGSYGDTVETKAESLAAGSVMQTRVAKERAKVGRFYLNLAEVLGGLLAIHEEPESIAPGFVPAISKTLSYSILADSTMLLDSNQRLEKLMQFINFTAKSGWINLEPVLKEMATLSGLDPSLVVQPPSPRPPSEPNFSVRLTGMQDLMNPLPLGFLIKGGQAPDLKMIEAAKVLIRNSVMAPLDQRVGVDPMQDQGFPPMGPDGMPLPQEEMEIPQPPPLEVGDANPNWSKMPLLNKRTVEREP